MIGIERERTAESGDSLVATAERGQYEPVVRQDRNIVRRKSERGADERERLVIAVLLVAHDPEKMQRVDVVRRGCENARIERGGLSEHAAAMQRHCTLQARRRLSGRGCVGG